MTKQIKARGSGGLVVTLDLAPWVEDQIASGALEVIEEQPQPKKVVPRKKVTPPKQTGTGLKTGSPKG